MHECNLLIATSVLEEGIELPRCNLVVRFDEPQTYRSYVHCKGRARAQDAHFILLIEKMNSPTFIHQLAEFMNIEQVSFIFPLEHLLMLILYLTCGKRTDRLT